MKKDNFESFIMYGIEQYATIKECIRYELMLLLFSLPLFILERLNLILLIIDIMPSACYLVSVMILIKNKRIEGAYYILHNGILSACISLLFALGGIWLLRYLFGGKDRIFLLCMITTGYLIAFLLYCYILKKLAQKKDIKDVKKANVGIPFTLCGFLGISAAKMFAKDIDNNSALEIMCVCCFFISYLSLLGILNFVKFYYIKNFEKDSSNKL